MHEQSPKGNPEIMGSMDLLLPQKAIDLCMRYGAKAGIQLYLEEKCPDLPFVHCMVPEPGEPNEVFADRVIEQYGRKFPLIVRSSSLDELQPGTEGKYPSIVCDDPDILYGDISAVRRIAGHCMVAPYFGKKKGYNYVGTVIEHPNLPGEYVFSSKENAREREATGSVEYYGENGLQNRPTFSSDKGEIKRQCPYGYGQMKQLLDEMPRIATLLDDRWAYQVEYLLGRKEPFITQVRPLLPKAVADFTLGPPPRASKHSDEQIIIGVTPREGIVVDGKDIMTKLLHSSITRDKNPNRGFGVMIFEQAFGMLRHDDVGILRKSGITIYTPEYYRYAFNNDQNRQELIRTKTDKEYRVISDGRQIRFDEIG